MLTAIAGRRCADLFSDALLSHFDRVFVLPPDPSVAPEVADHPDMILSFVGDAIVLPCSYYDANRSLIGEIADAAGKRIAPSGTARSADYPHDIGMNVLVTEHHLFGRLDFAAPEIISSAADAGLCPICTRQGYTACSALACGSIIVTGDPSIGSAAAGCGYDVITVDQSGIRLDGYDHGFIGGSGGIIGNTAFFLGDPSATVGTESLPSELASRGISSVALSPSPLTDFGGIKLFIS